MATHNRMNIALWVITGVVALAYFSVGVAMFVGRMNATLIGWGFTEGSGPMVGILAIAGAMGLMFVRTAGWSAVALMVLTVGAVWTLAVHDQWTTLIAPVVGFVALASIVWARGLTLATRETPIGGAPAETANT